MERSKIKDLFGVKPIDYPAINSMTSRCVAAYRGMPDWLDKDEHVRTINFAKAICEETARLTTLATKISTGEGPRAEYLQGQIDKVYHNLRPWVEYSFAHGVIILKPDGNDIEVVYPDDFAITHVTAGRIDGAVFQYTEAVERADEIERFVRFEYHRFEGKEYIITNKCFSMLSGKEVGIEFTPWADLLPEVGLAVDRPLFAVLTTPHANGIDTKCPLSTPVFANAMEELRDLDVAYSRNAFEIEQSKRTILIDSDRMMPGAVTPELNKNRVLQMDIARRNMGLPDMVRAVEGSTDANIYNEINPSLNTETRIAGINALLSQIGYKVGFANGYFVFNEASGIQTATGVEANQQRTIQFVKDCRDKLEDALTALVYAINQFADIYQISPSGDYELVFDFGDITYNRDEDRQRWWGYVTAGYVPAWMFFVKFEGMTEDEAKAMVTEAGGNKDLFAAYE